MSEPSVPASKACHTCTVYWLDTPTASAALDSGIHDPEFHRVAALMKAFHDAGHDTAALAAPEGGDHG